MANPSEIVTDFISAFTSGEIARARGLVGDEFWFEAPLMRRRGNVDDYFARAERKATHMRPARILRQWTDGDEVSTIYDIEIGASAATLRMSEWHSVRNGRVASILMIFNGADPAVGLMRDALKSGG